MHLAHDAEEIASPEFAQVFLRESFGHEALRQHEIIGCRGESAHAAVAVEVRADADVVDAGHFNHIHDVAHGVDERCLAVFAQESVVEGGLCDTVAGSDGA